MADRRRRAKATKPKLALSSGFARRVANKEVDLIKLIEEGIPPLEFLPGSSGILVRGTRHTIIGPRKSGKSIATLVQAVSLVQQGLTVIVLDRENGQRTYGQRLQEILEDWGEAPDLRNRIKKHLRYIAFPTLKFGEGAELAAWAKAIGADIVVFDSQRMFLTDLGLSEDAADDYAKFAGEAIDPLFQAGIATLVLDNTGHNDSSRARGSSAKQDLPEVLFVFSADPPFSIEQKGHARLTLGAGDSRVGTQGEWTMVIGGGTFEEWKERPLKTDGALAVALTGAASMEHEEARKKVLKFVSQNAGCSQSKVVKGLRGKGAGTEAVKDALQSLVVSGYIDKEKRGNAFFYYRS
jgi:hypothetical protein